MEPQVRFCTSADGTRIAFSTLGDHLGTPLIVAKGFAESLEWYWELPARRALLNALAEKRCVIDFDRRGVGASQRDVDDLSLEAQVGDLNAVADDLRLERFDVSAGGDHNAVAVAYAVQHPERIRRLLLWDPYACGAKTFNADEIRSVIELIRGNWRLARSAIADISVPNGPIEAQRWYARKLREIISPELAAKYVEFQANVDIRPLLPRVKVPALVVHRRPANRLTPVTASREVAGLIPDARFVLLDADSGLVLSDSDCENVARLTQEFLDDGPGGLAPAAVTGLVTILFTDLASSTALTQRLGDAKAQELVRAHNGIVREALAAQGGSEIKHTGDGIMASFPTASGALECAIAIQRAVGERGDPKLQVHIGVNAGEPVAEESDLFGTSVQLARRICDHAEAGQILASNVVRELAAGKGFLFADIGEVIPKGFEEPVRLYEVRWREA